MLVQRGGIMVRRWMCLMTAIALVHSARPAPAGEKPERTAAEVRKKLNAILSVKGDDRTQSLQRLKAYRYLAEVPYEDLALDPEYDKACLAAVKLCEKIGKLDHQPKNPGLPEDEYKLALKGTTSSSLCYGTDSLA